MFLIEPPHNEMKGDGLTRMWYNNKQYLTKVGIHNICRICAFHERNLQRNVDNETMVSNFPVDWMWKQFLKVALSTGGALKWTIHRVGSVPGFLSSRPNWVRPPPHPKANVVGLLWFRGGGTLACGRASERTQFRRGDSWLKFGLKRWPQEEEIRMDVRVRTKEMFTKSRKPYS